jgi:tRNA (pseudouridine54-N1)-methyltransferase
MRRFVVLGQTATASPEFSLIDIAGTSGRLDVLLRCLRSALCVSHGLRRDTVVYLVLLGGEMAPRTVRVEGAHVKYVRPDERSLAIMLQKALSRAPRVPRFHVVRDGLAVSDGGLDVVLADIGASSLYAVEEGATDVRAIALDGESSTFFIGDHRGFDDGSRATLASRGAIPIGVGPISVHADDAITLLVNELDRRSV